MVSARQIHVNDISKELFHNTSFKSLFHEEWKNVPATVHASADEIIVAAQQEQLSNEAYLAGRAIEDFGTRKSIEGVQVI